MNSWLIAAAVIAAPDAAVAEIEPPAAVGAQVRRVVELLDRWDVVEAEKAIAGLLAPGSGAPPALVRVLEAELRFYQGEYAAAQEIVDQIDGEVGGSEHWTRLKQDLSAARAETEGHVEVRSPDGRFVIRHPPGPDAVLAPLMLDALPAIRERLGRRFGLVPDHPILVEVYGESASLGRVTGLGAQAIENSGTIAICKFNRLMITSPLALVRGYGWLDTLAHEYVHLLVAKLAGSRVPIWLHEGIAKYHESFWASDEPPRLHPGEESIVAVALKDDQLITFGEMSPSMALLPTTRHTMLAFAEVQTVVEHLLEQQGDGVVRRLLHMLATGEARDDQDAIRRLTGLSFPQFERNWKAWLRRQKYEVRRDAGVTEMKFKKSSRSDDLDELEGVEKAIADHVRLGDLLRGKDRHKAGLREYERALARSGNGWNALIRTKMASAHLALGDAEAAVAAIGRVPELHHGYSLAYVLLGKAFLRLKRWDEANVWLGRSLGYNPYDPAVHMGLQQACDALRDDACVRRAVAALTALRSGMHGDADPAAPEGAE